MKQALIISGHPNLAQSTANSLIISEVKKQLDNVEIRRTGSNAHKAPPVRIFSINA